MTEKHDALSGYHQDPMGRDILPRATESMTAAVVTHPDHMVAEIEKRL
jgi:hypothetical protein